MGGKAQRRWTPAGWRRPAAATRARTWLTLALLALLTPLAAWAATSPADEIVVLDERPGDGEQCLVCRSPVHGASIVEMRLKGRTFHVRADMVDTFRDDPGHYFRSLEARSGLFDEIAVTDMERSGAYGWFYFGLYVLAGLVSAAACGALAVGRARPPWRWFFAGLLLNVAALVALLISPRGRGPAPPAGVPRGLRKVPTTRAPVACPRCGAENHPAAASCRGCGRKLSPRVEAETVKVRREAER